MTRSNTPTPIESATKPGQAIYTPLALKGYDLWVLGVSNHWLWRCPTSKLRALYDANVASPHLDIGVGTGYFLRHARWTQPNPDITLFDLNENSLAAAQARIAGLKPKIHVGDVLQPISGLGPFQSVGLNYLLHCLPGAIPEKAIVFDNVAAISSSGARIFGATILQGDARRSRAAQKLMDVYNARGIFCNSKDTQVDLTEALEQRFEAVSIELCGCVALFSAIKS